MPKKTSSHRRKNRIEEKEDFFSRIFHFFPVHPFISYTILTFILMGIISTLDDTAQFFKASILESQITFDGTVMPLQKVPNWVQTGGYNDRSYRSYQANELIPLMPYNSNELQSSRDDDDTINAQITYTVAYLGNYQFDHVEEVGSHLAVDIRAPIGTPVFAVANGVVTKAVEQNYGFGYHIVHKIPNAPVNGDTEDLYVTYSHLSKVEVSNGEVVEKGQKIGEVGDTGTATTAHVHFQIDRDSAPWHPYWPFSSTEASAAGLSFWQAINAGLGLENAKEHTIHPLMFVQEYFDGSGSFVVENSSSDTPDSSENNTAPATVGTLEEFEIEASPTRIFPGDTMRVSIMALDDDGHILTSFEESDVQVTVSDADISIPAIRFHDGRADFDLVTQNSGRVKIAAEYGDIDDSLRVTVEEEVLHSAPEETSGDGKFDHLEIIPEASFALEGQSIDIEVRAVSSDGTLLTDFIPQGGFALNSGHGQVSPGSLRADKFEGGIAQVRFTAEKLGTATISAGSLGSAEVEVLGELKPVNAFEIEAEKQFIRGVPEKVVIRSIDEVGNLTPLSFRGTVRVSVTEGEGIVKPNELTSQDFVDGKVEVELIALESEPLVLKAQAGVLVGESGKLYEDTNNIFTDVSDRHENAKAIEYLKKNGIVGGYPDGSFQPDRIVNRAEATKMLLEGFNIPVEAGQSSLKDIAPGQWFADYVATAEKNGIVGGYPDGTFRPANTINRAEFFKILLETDATALRRNLDFDPFEDVSADDWFASYALFAKDNRLLDFNRSFLGNREITRGEVAEAMYRLLK